MANNTLEPSIEGERISIQDIEQCVQLECKTTSVDPFARTSKNENTTLGVLSKKQNYAAMRLARAVDEQNEFPKQAEKRTQPARLRGQRARKQNNKSVNARTDEVEVTKEISKSPKYNTENSTKKVETPVQTIRRRLMARLRAQRAREKKKAQVLDFTFDDDSTSSSSQSEQYGNNWDDVSCDTNSQAIHGKDESNSEVELPAANSSETLNTFDLDPLKMEPYEDRANGKVPIDSTSLLSDFVAEEMKRVREAHVIPSVDEDDDEEEQYFKKSFQAERLRIENALKHAEQPHSFPQQNFKLKEEEPTIDFVEFNSLNDWKNPLDCSRDGSSVEEDILNQTFNLNCRRKTTKRQMQAERMRKLRAQKKQLETPEEVFKRKECQRERAERARLKKKALQAGVLIESDMDQKAEDEGNEDKNKAEQVNWPKRLTRFQVKKNEDDAKNDQHLANAEEVNSNNSINSSLAQSRKQRIEDVDHSLDSHTSSSDTVARNRTRCAQRARERRAAETIEETEARRLRARIAKMKNRLSAQLAISDDQLQAEKARKAEEMRLLRQKKLAAETPEQAAERRRKQVLQARKSRSRILAAETPEETEARRAAGREYCRKRLSKLKEKETPEEKAQRIERERHYRKHSKPNQKPTKNSEVANNSTENSSSLNSSILEIGEPGSKTLATTAPSNTTATTTSGCPT